MKPLSTPINNKKDMKCYIELNGEHYFIFDNLKNCPSEVTNFFVERKFCMFWPNGDVTLSSRYSRAKIIVLMKYYENLNDAMVDENTKLIELETFFESDSNLMALFKACSDFQLFQIANSLKFLKSDNKNRLDWLCNLVVEKSLYVCQFLLNERKEASRYIEFESTLHESKKSNIIAWIIAGSSIALTLIACIVDVILRVVYKL